MRRIFTLLLFLYFICPITAFAQWERLNSPSIYEGEAGKVNCIATNDTFVWIGTETAGLFRRAANLIADWEAINNSVQSYTILSLTYSNGSLVATTERGIYLSTNNGNTWMPINKGLPLGQKITSFTAANKILFAATDKYGVFRSTDNGQNWAQANSGLLDNNILQVKADGNYVWALSRNAGLFKSVNGGQSWSGVSLPNNCQQCTEMAIVDSAIFIAQGNLLVSQNGGQNWATDTTLKNIKSITAYKGRLVANSQYRLYKSADTGKVWMLEQEFNLDSLKSIHTALSTPDEIDYLAMEKTGMYRGTIASVTWKPFNTGLLTANVQQIEENNGILYTIAYGSIYRTTDNGDNWVDIGGFSNTTVTSLLFSNDKILISTAQDGVKVAQTQFLIWQDKNNGLGNLQVNKLLKIGNTIYALTQNGIYLSPNEGSDWFKYADAIAHLTFTDMLFDNNTLYVGTTEGLYKSTNSNGFERVDSTNLPRRYVHFIRKINGQLWLKVGIDTHISTNGVVWPRYYYIGGTTFANAVSVVKNRMYASTTAGFMFTDTATENWSYIKSIEGLTANIFQSSSTHLFAGTGAGIWRLPSSNVVTAITTQNKNTLKIYPNPASSTIAISDAVGKVSIFSFEGKELIACNNCQTLSIDKLAAGVYFIKAETDKGILTQKLIKE